MKKTMLAAATVAFLSATSAWAGSDVQGTIQNVDPKSHQVTLSDGKTYVAMNNVDLTNLKAGDSMTISTENQNGQNVVTKINKNS